jgi:hypothetical protein
MAVVLAITAELQTISAAFCRLQNLHLVSSLKPWEGIRVGPSIDVT